MSVFQAGSVKTAPLVLLVLAAIGLSACQGTRLPHLSTRTSTPEPLTPAPTGQVDAEELQPAEATTDPENFPEAPGDGTTPVDVAATNAPEVSKNAVVGSWKASADGISCQMFLTLTKYGNNSRGGTRGCTGDLQSMRGWTVAGKQLVLFDESGNKIAMLYATGNERFDGQTSGGQAISLFR